MRDRKTEAVPVDRFGFALIHILFAFLVSYLELASTTKLTLFSPFRASFIHTTAFHLLLF